MHEFTLNKSTDEMDEDELRSTMDEFMDKHAENVEEYSTLETERDEFSETIESLSETTDALQTRFAEVVAEDSSLFSAEIVADRFSLDELMEKADAMGAFSVDTETAESVESDSDGETDSTFDDKPERAPDESGDDRSKFRDQAESDLRNVLGDF